MKNTKIIVIIVIIIIGILQFYLLYRVVKNSSQIYEATKYALANTLACPNQKDNDLFCEYINKDLPEPKPEDSDLTFSKYAANLVGKLEFKYEAPLPVVLSIYYNNTLFGWILKGESVYYVVYRGTHSINEWMQDFNFYQTRGFSAINSDTKTQITQKALLPAKGLQDIGGGTVMVHQGFLEIYNSFKDTVMKKLNEDKSKPVLVTGHSLGAAIAILTGVDLTLGNRQNRTIVFAPPRVGNTAFANLLNSQKTLLKWTNTSDIIPTMPYAVVPNISNPKNPYFFTDGGTTNYFTLNKKALINNHEIQTYIDYLNSING